MLQRCITSMRDSCMWIIAGPKTLRLASKQILPKKHLINGKTKTVGYGGNLQNIEKSMREIYISDGFEPSLADKCSYYMASGGDISVFTEEERATLRVLVNSDQSGAEALAVAYLCRDGNFRQLFKSGVKAHVYVAMHVFADVWKKKMKESHITGDIPIDIDAMCNTPIKDLKSNPYWHDLDLLIKDSDNWPMNERYYYLAKQTCHSANYGITAPPFRMNILEKSGGKILISKEESERFLLTYRALFPEIQEWHESVKRQVEETHMLYNLHSHPYTITTHHVEDSQWKELFAWIPQSTIGMITNIAFARMQEYIESNGRDWDNLLNGHDAITGQCPIGEEKELAAKQQEFIAQEFISPVDGVHFRMKSESQYGFDWAPMKQHEENGKMVIVNPCGLREVKL